MNDHKQGCEFWGTNDGRCHAIRSDFQGLQSDDAAQFDAEGDPGDAPRLNHATLTACNVALSVARGEK